MELSFRIQALRRPEGSREALFDHLVGVVESAVEGKGAPPVVVMVREEAIELVPVQPLVHAKVHAQRFLAALTRSRVDDGPHPEAVGMMGTFRLRRGRAEGPGVPMAQVFLEWPDNAWMHWRMLLDADGQRVDDGDGQWAATLGDPLPPQLGRWWSMGRRHRLGLALKRRVAEPQPLASSMVH